jgi:hypothetical protein
MTLCSKNDQFVPCIIILYVLRVSLANTPVHAMVKGWGIDWFVRKITRGMVQSLYSYISNVYGVRMLMSCTAAMVKGWGIFYFVRKFTRYMTYCIILCGAVHNTNKRFYNYILLCSYCHATIRVRNLLVCEEFYKVHAMHGAVHNSNTGQVRNIMYTTIRVRNSPVCEEFYKVVYKINVIPNV